MEICYESSLWPLCSYGFNTSNVKVISGVYGVSGSSYLSGSCVWFEVVSECHQLGAAMTDVVFTPVAPEGTLKRRTREIKK